MNKIRIITIIIYMLVAIMASAQTDVEKEAAKKAHKEAKALIKAGWQPASGMPSVEEQLKNSYLLTMQPLQGGQNRFIIGDAICRGYDYEQVRMQVVDMAKYNIINQLKVQVMSEATLINNNGSSQTDIHTHVSANQNLGNIIPVIDIFRELDYQEVEVQVRMIVDRANLKQY